jgi:DNA-binding transcriptional ArsR family regulator
MRARLAAARERNEAAPGNGSAPVRHRAIPGVPPEAMAVLMRLLGAPEGTTASASGMAIGKSKTVAYEYLTALKDRGIAELTGSGPNSRYRLAAEPVHEPRQEPGQAEKSPRYLTIQALAEAVHAGLADADEATREVLEKVWEIEHRTARPHLTVVPPLPDQASEGDAQ